MSSQLEQLIFNTCLISRKQHNLYFLILKNNNYKVLFLKSQCRVWRLKVWFLQWGQHLFMESQCPPLVYLVNCSLMTKGWHTSASSWLHLFITFALCPSCVFVHVNECVCGQRRRKCWKKEHTALFYVYATMEGVQNTCLWVWSLDLYVWVCVVMLFS